MNREIPGLSAKRLRAALAGGVVLAFGIVALEFVYFQATSWHRLAPPVDDRSRDFAVADANESAPAATDFRAAILAKPLFVQGRGIVRAIPLQVSAASTPAPVEPDPEVRLMGVQISEHDKLAVLQLGSAARAIRAREGQPIQNWTLDRIYPDHIVISKDSRSRSIYLGDTKQPADGSSAAVGTD